MARVLVTLPLGPRERAELERRLPDAELRYGQGQARDDLAWAEVVLGNADAGMLATSDVRWLHSPSVGLDAYDALRTLRPGLEVTNGVGVVDRAVAEHGLALLLALTRNLPLVVRAQGRRTWARQAFREAGEGTLLGGKRAHVLGYGRVARSVIGLLAAVGLRVTAYRRRADGDDPQVEAFRALDELPGALAGADVLVNVLPLREATRGIVGRAALAALPARAYYVSLGRGPTTDEAALVEALRSGALAGAALDVFADEPLATDSPLWELPNAIVSPHVAGRFDAEMGAYVTAFADRYAERCR
jgi:phosphoglycerate dehydrogenase-like enzyme